MRDTNVIDMNERRTKGLSLDDLEMKRSPFSTEQVRAGVATALVALIFLVTLANNSLLSDKDQTTITRLPSSGRAIASVPTGTSDWEDQMVSRLSKLPLEKSKEFGQRPSALDRLTLETLEGKYAVRLENGKIRELQFSSTENLEGTKPIIDRAAFLKENRELLPVAYNELTKVESRKDGDQIIEAYELVDKGSAGAHAKVLFRLDSSGRMISMKIN